MIVNSNTEFAYIDESVNILSNFAEQVNTSIEDLSYANDDIYTQLNEISTNYIPDIYEHISQIADNFVISYIIDEDDEITLVLSKN